MNLILFFNFTDYFLSMSSETLWKMANSCFCSNKIQIIKFLKNFYWCMVLQTRFNWTNEEQNNWGVLFWSAIACNFEYHELDKNSLSRLYFCFHDVSTTTSVWASLTCLLMTLWFLESMLDDVKMDPLFTKLFLLNWLG